MLPPLLAALAIALPAMAQSQPTPRLRGVTTTLEITPVLLAAGHDPGGVEVGRGGIPDLFASDTALRADLATHAETQALRNSVDHPDLRIILTVSEGLYRIVGRRSAGIERVEDLKGKRIAYPPLTSAAFYLHKMLATAGLAEKDVILIPFTKDLLAGGQVDAAVYWEPESQAAFDSFGADAIELYRPGVYRERYNLNATAASLADPAKRKRIVAFVRGVIRAACDLRADPSEGWSLAAASGRRPVHEVARSWGRQVYPAYLPSDLLEVMVEEEVWLARLGDRPARDRQQLAALIDPTVLREALAEPIAAPDGRRC